MPHAGQSGTASCLLIALCLVACGDGAATSPAAQQFANDDIVWVKPRQPFSGPPRPIEHGSEYFHDSYLLDRVGDAIPVRHHNRALDVNALGEVPDSGWFENRLGVRDLTPAEVGRGPTRDPPEPPFTIVGAKTVGASLGFIAEDAAGTRFVLELDGRDFAEIESSAAVIVNRILWAAGYHVPDERVLMIDRDELRVGDQATRLTAAGIELPLTSERVDELLEGAAVTEDGRYRILASRFVEGVPLGGFTPQGYRADDPNDRIPHQRLRALRGLYPLAAWLKHVDIKPMNSLDVWIPGPDGAGLVRHYLLDFDKSLGALAFIDGMPFSGHSYIVDAGRTIRRLFGAGSAPWQELDRAPVPGVGVWSAEHYDPGAFKTNAPFQPFLEMDRFDGYWGAKLVARFSREHLAAAIAQADYSDPRTAPYVLEVLLARQRQTVLHWFAQVTPLDRFAAGGQPDLGRLCFTDLLLHHGLGDQRPTRIIASGPGPWRQELIPDAGGSACATGFIAGPGPDRYTVIRLDLRRGDQAMPAVFVHLARSPQSGLLRVTGVQRT